MIENTQVPQIQKRSWLLSAGAIALVVTVGFSIYYQAALTGSRNQLKTLEAKKEELAKPLSGSVAAKKTSLEMALAIKSELKKIESTQIKWSKLTEKIDSIIPKAKGTNDQVAVVRSYNGDTNGVMSLNVSTTGIAPDPFADAAQLIRAFSAEPSFKNVFVPSLTKSVGSNGVAVLNFTVNFSYQQQNF